MTLTDLHKAAKKGDVEQVKRLVENGKDIESNDYNEGTPLVVACRNSKHDIARYLLKNGANPNAECRLNGCLALNYITSKGDIEMVKLLVEGGADIDTIGYSNFHGAPLRHSIYCGFFDISEYLIENGADVNYQSGEYGYTPLHAACYWGNIDLVRKLLDKGARKDIPAYRGVLPAVIAKNRGKMDIVEMLETV